MPKPDAKTIKKFGDSVLVCCEHKMAEIDMNEMYKVVRAMDVLKDRIEAEMIAGL